MDRGGLASIERPRKIRVRLCIHDLDPHRGGDLLGSRKPGPGSDNLVVDDAGYDDPIVQPRQKIQVLRGRVSISCFRSATGWSMTGIACSPSTRMNAARGIDATSAARPTPSRRVRTCSTAQRSRRRIRRGPRSPRRSAPVHARPSPAVERILRCGSTASARRGFGVVHVLLAPRDDGGSSRGPRRRRRSCATGRTRDVASQTLGVRGRGRGASGATPRDGDRIRATQTTPQCTRMLSDSRHSTTFPPSNRRLQAPRSGAPEPTCA